MLFPNKSTSLLYVAAIAALLVPSVSFAQAPSPKPTEVQLTPEEIKEKELRKACKVDLCSAFHVGKPAEGQVACNVLKTWRKEQLTKMVSKGGVSWPWGNARCVTNLKFDRSDLAKAITVAEFELKLPTHLITCELEREKENYEIKMEIAPKVQFKQGKAVKAQLNWGKIEAPALAKTVLWSATAADNTFGALQNTIVEDINDFIGTKCFEVKSEWKVN